MRAFLVFLALAGGLASARAQGAVNMDLYPNSDMVQRWNSSTQKAIAATKPEPVGRKPKKPDPNLVSSLSGRKFDGSIGKFDRKASGQNAFLFDQKVAPSNFGTRSFFGLKNPWFGRKVAQTDTASLWSKTEVANANRKYPLEAAQVREFYQADKKATEPADPVPTRAIKPDGKSQGFLTTVSEQKNLTIDQVRELLNKK